MIGVDRRVVLDVLQPIAVREGTSCHLEYLGKRKDARQKARKTLLERSIHWSLCSIIEG